MQPQEFSSSSDETTSHSILTPVDANKTAQSLVGAMTNLVPNLGRQNEDLAYSLPTHRNKSKYYISKDHLHPTLTWKKRYEKALAKLLKDRSICQPNRDFFNEFFSNHERKLKRQNGLAELDAACYKTLVGYIGKFKNVNKWFANKPWKDLTREDIQKVYDDLEDGRIVNCFGQRFKDRQSYYNKIFRSKPFKMLGKFDLAKEVLEDFRESDEKEVRYVTEDEFRKLVSVVSNPHHLALLWLQWDIGENIGALLHLVKKDFIRQTNSETNEDEYLVNLPRSKIKRSRKTRSEPTLYPETTRYLDAILPTLKDEDRVFDWGHRYAYKIILSACKRSQSKCMPHGDSISWKDLRSGMACHLLKMGWTRDEVNARLGHTPSSKSLNAYINYLALDRHRPQKRLFNSTVEGLKNDLTEAKQKEKIAAERLKRQQEESDAMKAELVQTLKDIKAMKQSMMNLLSQAGSKVEANQ